MNKKIINPPSLAKPTGYANGVLTQGGKILFLAGQTAMDNTGGVIAPNDMVAQFTQCLSNLKPIGASYRSFFGKYYPAMTLVEVKSLFDDEAMIEIEGIAVISDQ